MIDIGLLVDLFGLQATCFLYAQKHVFFIFVK